jgi:hypothetical protein
LSKETGFLGYFTGIVDKTTSLNKPTKNPVSYTPLNQGWRKAVRNGLGVEALAG